MNKAAGNQTSQLAASMADVTADLNRVFAEDDAAKSALSLILQSPYFGRETLSSALGELSEHLIAQAIGGARIERGNKGFDLLGSHGERIEVKARQLSRWGNGLQFNFSKHTAQADLVYCLAWDDTLAFPELRTAYRMPVPDLLRRWGTPDQQGYAARTNLGLLHKAFTGLAEAK